MFGRIQQLLAAAPRNFSSSPLICGLVAACREKIGSAKHVIAVDLTAYDEFGIFGAELHPSLSFLPSDEIDSLGVDAAWESLDPEREVLVYTTNQYSRESTLETFDLPWAAPGKK